MGFYHRWLRLFRRAGARDVHDRVPIVNILAALDEVGKKDLQALTKLACFSHPRFDGPPVPG